MTNSRSKGKRGELELAKELRGYGIECVRGQQHVGRGKNPQAGQDDVIGLPGIHIECKRVEKLNLDAAMNQSVGDTDPDVAVPAVMHRKNFDRSEAAEARKNGEAYTQGKWKVTMLLEDWVDLYKMAQAGARVSDGWESWMADENPLR